jgi:hypothetical protein
MPSTRPRRRGRTARSAHGRIRRDVLYVICALAFGVVALPFIVYYAGAASLGAYEGGAAAFLGKLYGDVLHGAPGALALLLGPAALVLGLRLLLTPFYRH